tara:strand:+ start:3727 stop:4713 length:987 start_codon:yes stop_codon:yes gene_type:complete
MIKSILITGGTGSFGNEFVKLILSRFKNIKRLIIFSRDEQKQFNMSQKFTGKKYPAIRFFIGDVRNRDRLRRALDGIDCVVHAAALKHVPAGEYNPIEFIQTNIIGAQNIIEASIDAKVKQVVALSTDKAAAPINLYGATKLCSDRLFISANNYSGNAVKFSVVRYGNVFGSRGSVVPLFLSKKSSGTLPITNKEMTRFNVSLKDGAEMVLWALKNSKGGEIFVPKLYSYNILDLAKAIGPYCKYKVVGIRPGEKIHEELITKSDCYSTVDLGKYYAILPISDDQYIRKYLKNSKGKKLKKIESYNSKDNKKFLSISDIKKLLKVYLN